MQWTGDEPAREVFSMRRNGVEEMNRICLLIVAGLGLGTINTGCMSARGGNQYPTSQTRDPDRSPPIQPAATNPPKFVMRGDQVYELLVPPSGSAHTVIPAGSIALKGHIYVPRAAVFQPSAEVPSNELPFPSKMPEKEKGKSPPTGVGMSDQPRRSATALPDDEELPQATITGVRAMTPEEVAAWEKEKAAKKAAEAKPPAAKLGVPIVEEERTPKELPKFEGPLLGAPVAPYTPPTVPTPTITPPPGALPRQDWTPIPPAGDLPPEDTRPKEKRTDLTTSNRK